MKKNKSILIELAGKPLDWAETGLQKSITLIEDLGERSEVSQNEKAKTKKRLSELKQIAKIQELQMDSLFASMRDEFQKDEDKVNNRMSELNQLSQNNSEMEQAQ